MIRSISSHREGKSQPKPKPKPKPTGGYGDVVNMLCTPRSHERMGLAIGRIKTLQKSPS
jgi:hypothetical protein